MIGKIISIKNSLVYLQLSLNIYETDNLINKNVIFDDRFVGEIISLSNTVLEVSLIGEIINNSFVVGGLNMPSFGATCRLTTEEEIDIIYGIDRTTNAVKLGKSFIYNNYEVSLNINSFFSGHFAIFGNSGSGKSHFVARLFQGIFYDAKKLPFNTNVFLFDVYGEYQQAFNNINRVNANLNYKVITTDLSEDKHDRLMIPFWLLSVDDICLLLDVDDMRQIAIIEKALKLVSFFSQYCENVISQKNDIIARCLLDVIFSSFCIRRYNSIKANSGNE